MKVETEYLRCFASNRIPVMYPNHHRAGMNTWRGLFSWFCRSSLHFWKGVFWKRQVSRFTVWASDSALVQKLPAWKAFSKPLFYWQFNCTVSGSTSSTLLLLVQQQQLIFFPNLWLLYLFCPLRGSWSLVCQSTAVHILKLCCYKLSLWNSKTAQTILICLL